MFHVGNYYFIVIIVTNTEGLTATCAAAFGLSLPNKLELQAYEQ